MLLPHVHSAAQRRSIALDHLKKCLDQASRFHAALDRPARRPQHLRIASFAGDAEKTAIAFLATPSRPKLHRAGKGDGVVPVASAMHCPSPRQAARTPARWDDTRIFRHNHSGLACKRRVNQHVISLLVTER